MITTTIKLVGLLVTLLLDPNDPNKGVRVVMGDFQGSKPAHIRFIAWPQGSRITLRPPDIKWPDSGRTFTTPNGTVYEYAFVQFQDVSLTGISEPFSNQTGAVP